MFNHHFQDACNISIQLSISVMNFDTGNTPDNWCETKRPEVRFTLDS